MKSMFQNEKKLFESLDKLINALDSFQKNAAVVKVHSSHYFLRSHFDIEIIMKEDRGGD